ncbi:MAG: TGS domain-containing protein [Thermodesulfovibrionales bacterium]|nr:TGS domain-containing protein [Thermodesulfovibrionales bacterium]
MPTNLPPEYFIAEERFKEAKGFQEKIKALEALIATVPKHKGTDKLRADLRRKLSLLRQEALKQTKTAKRNIFTIEKQGASTSALAGLANSGKSSIIASLTKAVPVIADYPMSTVAPLSGMMPFEDIFIQLIDLPPIGNESTDGWVSSIIRQSNSIIIVVDLSDDPIAQTELLLEQFEIWRIPLRKRSDRDSIDPNKKPVIIAACKLDLSGSIERLEDLKRVYESLYPIIGISNKTKIGLEELRRTLFEISQIIRVYSKEPGKEPDLQAPFILPRSSTVLDLACKIHKDFLTKFKYACVWGSTKYPGQRVQKDYIMQDKDIVEIHLK